MIEHTASKDDNMSKVPPIQSLLDFRDNVVLVTGASGGIGAGIATRFAEAGAAVVVNYHQQQSKAEAVVDAIEMIGGKAIAVQADVTQRDDIERLVNRALETFDGLDVLINNAGVYPLASLLDMTEDAWNVVINANLLSVHLCTQMVAKKMIDGGKGGAIVNVASIEGETPAPMHSHYNAAKGGVLMHTRTAAHELGAHGIRVNAVSPGLIWRKEIEQDWPDGVRRYRKAAPLARLGQPDDVADACLFLASPAARWITGTNLRVDGGVMTNMPY
ncbi:MAG: SDR family NAD(P)-dependent oxidoreductase [Acidiferrobacterales bacterium]